jgi:hypothetical protein
VVSLQYLAGFIDGEGYLSLGKIPRRGRSTEFPLRAVVYNSNLEILTEIQRTWGGTVSNSGTRNPRWKPGYALIWTDAAASRLLAIVAPHLRVKSRQAAELLNFHEHVRKCRRVRDRRGHLLPLSESELKFREACHERLKLLNARGPNLKVSSGPTQPDASLAWTTSPSIEYLAGFVDGEGSLMISKWRDRESHPHYRPRISLSNTNRAVLEDVKRAYGGILASQPSPKPEWKDSFQLVWTNGMVERLLMKLMPYLRLKRNQAAVIIGFVRHQEKTPRARQGPNGRFFAPLSADVIAFREDLYQRMKELNAKGPRPPSSTPTRI